MADKEATVYIVDVGKSMGRVRHGRNESDLDWAMRYVWDGITTTVSYESEQYGRGLTSKVENGRKTAMLGVVGLNTNETRNDSSNDSSHEHISVWQEISQVLMPDLRKLRQVIKLSDTDSGDAVSAIVIAVMMIINKCKKLKYRRKIVLVTNGLGDLDMDQADAIVEKLKDKDGPIELAIAGVDFDDAEYGFKEEGKSQVKTANEQILKDLVEKCNGSYGTLAQAVAELDQPRVKRVNPVPTFRGQLRLGDPENYETALSIDVERFAKTHRAVAPPASSFAMRGDGVGGPSSTASSDTVIANGDSVAPAQDNQSELAGIRTNRKYEVANGEGGGEKTTVDREELAKGYEYGRTAVAISESDQNITKLDTEAAMEIIGFALKDKYERYTSMSQSNVVVGARANPRASLALSCLIHALAELEMYAIARVVKKDMADPLLILLAPWFESGYECLIEVQLPFAEDLRAYRFPPLDKVVTVSGKNLAEHRNLPNDKLMSAMSAYVDKLDLSTFGKDDNGDPAEYMAMEDTYSPIIHRIGQAVRWRAIHPTEPIPPPAEVLLRYSKQPEELQEKTKSALHRVMKAADVKKVPPKVRGRKRNRETDKPLSGLNVDELLHREKRFKISPDNAIPEFKQMVASAEEVDAIRDAVKQMTVIIEDQIRHSMGDNDYDRAVEGLNVMRSEMVELEEPELYNDAVRSLKKKILDGELGGDRSEMWYTIRKTKVGLIDKKLSNVSSVTEEEARAFLAPK